MRSIRVGTRHFSIATTTPRRATCRPPRWHKAAAPAAQSAHPLHQGSPDHRWRACCSDETADIGLATESLAQIPELVSLPCYEWQHVMVVRDHPLAEAPRITLEQLATQPLVTYHASFTGARASTAPFASCGLTPEIALEAIDPTCSRPMCASAWRGPAGREMAMQEEPPNSELVAPTGPVAGQNVTRVAFKRGAHFATTSQLCRMLSDRLSRKLIERAMSGEATDYGMWEPRQTTTSTPGPVSPDSTRSRATLNSVSKSFEGRQIEARLARPGSAHHQLGRHHAQRSRRVGPDHHGWAITLRQASSGLPRPMPTANWAMGA